MDRRHLLIETFVHLPPPQLLEDLPAEAAVRVPAPGLHSVAELVAHVDHWQRWFLARCRGEARAMTASAAEGWPAVTAGQWDALRDRFLEGAEEVAVVGTGNDLDAPLNPVIEFPPLAHYTLRDAIVHVAQHNSHHLGQVVTLRQLMKLWPPAAGSFTW